MCTVSYLPLSSGGFVLTSNRDEAPARSPLRISRSVTDGTALLFPKDMTAGGTWVAAASSGRVAVLLNGAFERHTRQPPYRRSRGLMVIDLFGYDSVPQFLASYQFEGIEPFTLVVVEADQPKEIRWDGRRVHACFLPARSPHFWSSVTLYPEPVAQFRRQWFDQWLSHNPDPSAADILGLHRYGGSQDPRNGFVMNRDDVVRTVSITQVLKQARSVEMHYHDLLRQVQTSGQLSIQARYPLPEPAQG
ncbi:MAG: hypothetical protein RLY31_2159 [Bacteroidota bacterium]